MALVQARRTTARRADARELRDELLHTRPPVDRPVRHRCRPVRGDRAVPVSYSYYFGDDDSTTTASPGSPHPDLEVTHAYARTGDVVVRVDTTYAGEYRIGQGEWTSIPDTLTVEGAGQDLEIVEALPQLVLE